MICTLGERKPEFAGSDHFVADSALLVGSVMLGHEASVWFHCVLRGDNDRIEIGERSNVQDGSVLHTDPGIPLTVGANVTIGHKAILHGCTIGDHSLIGIGSTLLNHSRIGRNSIVGAQALVAEGKEYPDGVLILGTPARVARELTDDEIAMIGRTADTYVANAKRYRTELRGM